MNGSNRSTSEHSGSGVEDDAASVSSPSLRRTAETTAAASAGSWLTYTHSPPFIPAARVSAVGSANRETRPAQELVVKKAGCVFTSATTARARASTWPARERSPASSASSARVDALRCAKASIVNDVGDESRERPPRAVRADCERAERGSASSGTSTTTTRAADRSREARAVARRDECGQRRRRSPRKQFCRRETWPAVETCSAPRFSRTGCYASLVARRGGGGGRAVVETRVGR